MNSDGDAAAGRVGRQRVEHGLPALGGIERVDAFGDRPNVNDAMTPGLPRRRRRVERHLGGRVRVRTSGR